MARGTLDTREFFASLDAAMSGLLQMISSADSVTINMIPFADSWTAAQLAAHVIKSNKAILQALNMQGKDAARDPVERVAELKAMFLDFTAKFNSPEFTRPKQGIYERELLIAEFKKSIERLKELRDGINLCEIISLPAFGELTKLELLYFVLYHTQRHLHQLKNIFKTLESKKIYHNRKSYDPG